MSKQQKYPKNFKISGLLLLGLAALAINGLHHAKAAAGSGPRALLTETSHDFGEAYEDRKLSYTFIVRNTGDEPLEISNVDPDCACTVASYNRTIPAGGQGEITLSLKPYSVMHQFRKETRITVNDPERPMFSLVLLGVAKPFIEIQPSHIIRLRGSPNEELRGEVRFTSHLPGPWQITNYRSNIPEKIDVNLKTVERDRVYVLEVKNKSQQSGPYAGLIELTTNSKERPRLIVRVFGESYLPSASSP